MASVVLSSVEDAIGFLQSAPDEEIDITFSGELKTLEIEIEGALFKGELTGELARGIVELQDQLYRAAAFAIKEKEGRQGRLTKAQREAIELKVDVEKGCTLVKIDAGNFAGGLLKILSEHAANMTPAQITLLAVGAVAFVAVGWLGKHAIIEYFKAKTAVAAGTQETERLKAAVDANVRIAEEMASIAGNNQKVQKFADATATGLTEIVARATNATSVKVGRVELDEEQLAALRKRAPKMKADALHEIGDFRVIHVNGEGHTFKLTLVGNAIPSEFDVEYDQTEFSGTKNAALWAAIRSKAEICLEVTAVQLRDKVKGAVLVDIEPDQG